MGPDGYEPLLIWSADCDGSVEMEPNSTDGRSSVEVADEGQRDADKKKSGQFWFRPLDGLGT